MNLLLIITGILFTISMIYLIYHIGYWMGWSSALVAIQKMRSGVSK
jgi:hypothetical protein